MDLPILKTFTADVISSFLLLHFELPSRSLLCYLFL